MRMERFFILILLLSIFYSAPVSAKLKKISAVSGTYRCWMFSVGSGRNNNAGDCLTGSAPLVLNANGTYRFSSSSGSYYVRENRVYLSGMRLMRVGKLVNGNQLVFQYKSSGRITTVTYLKQGPASAPASSHAGAPIPVSVFVRYTKDDGTFDWVNSADLYPAGADTSTTDVVGETVTAKTGKLVLEAYFREVPNGRVYDLYLDTGTAKFKAGRVDLRRASGQTKIILDYAPRINSEKQNAPAGQGQQAQQSQPAHQSQPPTQGKPCNPDIPNYSQPGCIHQ